MVSDPMVGVFDASSRARSLRRNSTKRSFAVRLLYFDFFDTFRFTKPEKVDRVQPRKHHATDSRVIIRQTQSESSQ